METQTGKQNTSSQLRGADGGETKSNAIKVPSISLPKGGGAIKGIDEKFSVNAVNGTASFSIPLPFSPARALTSSLNLSYSSGAGNGIFGLGWSLGLPSIKRKTDRELPKYFDAIDSDVFLFSEAEDLVPEYKKDVNGNYVIYEKNSPDGKYTIRFYRPRIEGLFARIERWTSKTDSEIKWRVITKENITTLFGWSKESRICDPQDESRIFKWMPEFIFDDKGNCAHYHYKKEDKKGFDASLLHNKNRIVDDELTYTNLYLEQIRYGNKTPYKKFNDPFPEASDYMFQTVFDYGEYDDDKPWEKSGNWDFRKDAFSTYKAGFEIRATRLCKRVLQFHHFDEYDGLVKSIKFDYDDSAQEGFTFLKSATSYGYAKQSDGTYNRKHLPPMEFTYQKHEWSSDVHTIASEDLVHAPSGLDTPQYQFTDLFNEGLSGILTEQGGGWYYKHNLGNGKFEQAKPVSPKPSFAGLGRELQLADLDADGGKQIAHFGSEPKGYFELSDEEEWEPFKAFESLPNIDLNDPNTRMVDLSGDGKPDILISEDNVFVWYESFGRKGYSGARKVTHSFDEEKGPHIVFADATQSIFLADMSGDGLTDIVRIRNGEICYWPNLGYGKFAAKIGMDNAPLFDYPEAFNPTYLRIADIDGSGTPDIIYLGKDKFSCWMNLSGNSFAIKPYEITSFPKIDNLSKVTVADLLGNGVACIVWSSPLEKDAQAPLKYIDLMNSKKPHIMTGYKNNLGAETRVRYAPSTKFYLADKLAGKPWITRLPFPVHVVERVETYDHISRNRFVTRYAYHHGYFDGEEREFRGFGMVEQWDTEEFATLSAAGDIEGATTATNTDPASHVPPVHTKTWFHTGVYLGRNRVSRYFAGLLDGHDTGEYYREPGLNDEQARALLLDDTVLPDDLTIDEEREACRALKGTMLRQEVYADDAGPDASDVAIERSKTPYSIIEQNFTVKLLQGQGNNRHSVFFTHPLETITYHYERNPADPRIQHAMTLEVDEFGNVHKQVAIGYGRRPNLSPLTGEDKTKQEKLLVTYTENTVTKSVDGFDAYRTPLPAETRTYELTGYTPTGPAGRFQASDFVEPLPNDAQRLVHVFDSEIQYEEQPTSGSQRRLIEQVRTHYRRDDLTDLLPLGELEPLSLPGESYKLAFTPGLLAQVYQRSGQALLPNPANVLGGQGAGQGGYVELDDERWWIPSGQPLYGENAAEHFYLARGAIDPFGNRTSITYDSYDLLTVGSEDPLQNQVQATNDYRVLQPWLLTDPNDNRSAVAFDELGMVVKTALMGKEGETDPCNIGDTLDDPTTILEYELFNWKNNGRPNYVYIRAREQHGAENTRWQASYSYSDGLGREIQKKIQAEPGPVPIRDDQGHIVIGENGQPMMTDHDVEPRWVGSGWTIFNNKGKPVRKYEPFFTDTHNFEFEPKIGVSPILFYDPLGRPVATLHPNHTWEKVIFDPWRQETLDVNDTILQANPGVDPDVGGFFRRLEENDYLPTWHAARINGDMGVQEQQAAQRTEPHADTPAVAYFDALGRPFLTIADNGLTGNGETQQYETRVELDIEGNQRAVRDAVKMTVDRHQNEVFDPLGRLVMRYDYTMAGPDREDENSTSNLIHQASMEAGERWILNDVAGNPIHTWDSRGHHFRSEYDELRRPVCRFVQGGDNEQSDPRTMTDQILIEKIDYGEGVLEDKTNNLRTRQFKTCDGSGVVTNEAYDFKGNLLRSNRRLCRDYKEIPNWSQEAELEDPIYITATRYDALNRPIQQIAPYDRTSPTFDVTQQGYNEAGLLESVHVWLGESSEPENRLNPATATHTVVENIDYDAKGQRTLIRYGNDAETRYAYDHETFRLIRLYTRRSENYDQDCGIPPDFYAAPDIPPPDQPCGIQNIRYTYDPSGNITHIRDLAQPRVYFANQVVDAGSDYRYDPLYRLVAASGREHATETAPSAFDRSREDRPLPSTNPQALRRYVEQYEYDEVGNFKTMSHHAGDNLDSPGTVIWRRTYKYEETSQLEPEKTSNRLTETKVANQTQPYSVDGNGYDAHGNMLSMPHLSQMQWDFQDRLLVTGKQVVNDNPDSNKLPETTWYVYDASGQRVRKVTEWQNGKRKDECIYLGGFEIYRSYNGSGETVKLERETLHVMDDKQRVAMIETKTVDTARKPSPSQLVRYQINNHLGSSTIELDDFGQIISYEEYYPYGGTAYQAKDANIRAAAKRYRYTGKERDEENGFYYYGARYYASWLGRWVSCDPIGIDNELNVFNFNGCNPINYLDKDGLQSSRTETEVTEEQLNIITSGLNSEKAKELIKLIGDMDIKIYFTSDKKKLGEAAAKYLLVENIILLDQEKFSNKKLKDIISLTQELRNTSISLIKMNPNNKELHNEILERMLSDNLQQVFLHELVHAKQAKESGIWTKYSTHKERKERLMDKYLEFENKAEGNQIKASKLSAYFNLSQEIEAEKVSTEAYMGFDNKNQNLKSAIEEHIKSWLGTKTNIKYKGQFIDRLNAYIIKGVSNYNWARKRNQKKPSKNLWYPRGYNCQFHYNDMLPPPL